MLPHHSFYFTKLVPVKTQARTELTIFKNSKYMLIILIMDMHRNTISLFANLRGVKIKHKIRLYNVPVNGACYYNVENT